MDTTARAIDKQNALIAGLSTEVGKTQEALERLDSAQNQTALQTRAIGELMFDKLSPQEKLASIDGPLLLHLSDDQRADLRTVLTSQVKREQILTTASWIAQNANSIGTIAKNLGIQDQRLNTVVNYATVANAALSQAMTGNYLGAIASVTGLMGSQIDPAAERHKEIMDFIGKGFRRIEDKLKELDGKLDQVLRGQEQLFNGMVKLSEQMAEYNKNLHDRLDRVEFEQKLTMDAVVDLLWKDYKGCNVAWNFRNASAKYPYDMEKGGEDGFLGYEHMLVIKRRAHDEMITCAANLRHIWFDIKKSSVFGNILLLKFSKEAHEERARDFAAPGDDKFYTAGDLQQYLEQIYTPSFELGAKYAVPATGSLAKLLSGLTTPAANVDQLRKKARLLAESTTSTCGDDRTVQGRIYEYLCKPDEVMPEVLAISDAEKRADNDAEKRARDILRDAISPDRVHDISTWSKFVAPYYDVAEGNSLISPSRLLDPQQEVPYPKGKELISGAMGILDFAIAQYSMLYGDLAALGLFDGLLWDGSPNGFSGEATGPNAEDRKRAYRLLKASPYMARNVLMLALDRSSGITGIHSAAPYRIALEYMGAQWENGQIEQAQELLRIQFGKAWRFNYDTASKTASAVIENALTEGAVTVPLPSVADFRERSLVYPPRMGMLLADRAQLAIQYADYVVFKEAGDTAKLLGILSLLADNKPDAP